MSRFWMVGLWVAGLVALVASSAEAQVGSGVVAGRVVDPQGAVVVQATVTLVSTSRRETTTRTGTAGDFAIDSVTPAEYTLQVDAPGFLRWSQKINVGTQRLEIAVTLQVAGFTEAVSVVGVTSGTLNAPTITGSRLGISLLDTPASVHIISGDAVRERGDQSVADAKTRAVGVTRQGDPGNGGGAVVARGFGGVGSVMQLFDGDQLFVGAETVTFPFDPWTVERIEVMGGPAGVLYGNGAIGGVVNVVPRKPNPFSKEGTIRVAGGSFNTWRAAIDAAGPLSERTSYRVDLSANRSGGYIDDSTSRSAVFSGSLRHVVSPTLTLTVSEDFGYQKPSTYFGTPTFRGVIDESRKSVNYNVADADIWYRDNWTQAKIEWQARPNVRVRSGLRLLATDRHWKNLESYTFNPSTNLIDRESYIEIFHRQRQYGDRTDAVITNTLGGRANTLSVGFDFNVITFQHTNNSPYGGASTTTVNNSTPGGFLNLAGSLPKYRTHTNHLSFFAEDRLVLSPVVSLVGGVRVDRYGVERTNLLNNSAVDRVYTPASGRGGVVFTVRPGLTAYGQFATSTDTIGNVISNSPGRLLFDPTTGRQLEAGVKQSLWQNRAEWTVAGYHIAKNNLLAPIPGNVAEVQQIGEQSSRGFEVTAALTLPVGLRLEGNIALLDARFDDFGEVVGGTLVSRAGNTPPSVPERAANLWLTWNGTQDWQVRGGMRHVGRRFWDNVNSTAMPGYTVVDAGLRKRINREMALDLFLYNVTNRLYATDFYYNEYAPQWMLGTPRSAEVALTFGF